MRSERIGAVDFPTLGHLIDAWIEQHCRIADGWKRRQPFVEYDVQFWWTANHWRVREGAPYDPDSPPMSQAFEYRRTDIVDVQKKGKGPIAACWSAVMAVGPDLFAGWARRGDVYDCADQGCSCGWYFEYDPGDPMGTRHPSPLIQILATSQDQVDNIWRPLTAMTRFQGSHLGQLLLPREDFIRIRGANEDDPELDRIDAVTSSANSRLGNPISGFIQDETGIYTASNGMHKTAQTMRRGASAMQGRGITTTNPWDPSEDSQAQRDYEADVPDVFTWYSPPPVELSFQDRRQRRRILQHGYAGAAHINVDAIMAECDELMLVNPQAAERFFGGRIVQTSGSWLSVEDYEQGRADVEVPPGSRIAMGFDGSDTGDWSALRAETIDGHRFTPTYGPDSLPTVWNPERWGGRVPRGEVRAAVSELFSRYKVSRMYVDPRLFESMIEEWDEEHGPDVVLAFPTYASTRMFAALTRYYADLTADRTTTHDGCELYRQCALNARRVAKPGERFLLGKPSPHQKIDVLMADVIAHEAAADARAAGWSDEPVEPSVFFLPRE